MFTSHIVLTGVTCNFSFWDTGVAKKCLTDGQPAILIEQIRKLHLYILIKSDICKLCC